MEARLVAVVVRALQAGKGVHHLAAAEYHLARQREDGVETGVELLASDTFYQTFRRVGHEESVLHGVAFLETAPRFQRVEAVDERAVRHTGTNESERIVEEFLPSGGEFHQAAIVVLAPDGLRPLCYGVCREAILQRVRDGEG